MIIPGGTCCVPKAVFKIEKTITKRIKLVKQAKAKGSNEKTVITISICIIGFKETSSTDGYVIIANCHYHNNVLGIYAVPYSEFYDKIGEVYYYEP